MKNADNGLGHMCFLPFAVFIFRFTEVGEAASLGTHTHTHVSPPTFYTMAPTRFTFGVSAVGTRDPSHLPHERTVPYLSWLPVAELSTVNLGWLKLLLLY